MERSENTPISRRLSAVSELLLLTALVLAGVAVLYLGFPILGDALGIRSVASPKPQAVKKPGKKAASPATPILITTEGKVALVTLFVLLTAGTSLTRGMAGRRREIGAHLRELRAEKDNLAVERGRLEQREAEYKTELASLLADRDTEAARRKEESSRRHVLQQAVESADDVVMVTEADPNMPARVVYVNPAFERMTGYAARDIIGKTPGMLQGPRTDARTLAYIRERLHACEALQAELINYRKDGSEFWVELNITPCLDANGWHSHWISIQRDITERKKIEEQIAWQATHDALTGLPNRRFYENRVQDALEALMTARSAAENAAEASNGEAAPQAASTRDGADAECPSVGVLFLDLDRFKNVNDSLGHLLGDKLLQQAAARFQARLRQEDLIARLGGDEFAVLLTDVKSEDAAARAAQRLLDALEDPFQIDGRELFVSASVGICLASEASTDVTALLRNADVAMYAAKSQGRNTYRFYTESMNARSLERLAVETHLRKALERNEFHLAYQPQVDLRTGQVIGVEALLRWENPTLGRISPAQFIPLAEETGLIVPIDEWVMREACIQAAVWQRQGIPLRVSVNLSARQFAHKNLVERVGDILSDTGLDPQWLDIELTERSLLKGPDVGDILRGLKGLGVRISVDDFGTGESALSYLKAFPLDVLKIDRSFVVALTDEASQAQGPSGNRNSEAIVAGVIGIAHRIGLEVIAEGIETEQQRACLRSLHCDAMQGYLFSPPTTAEEVLHLRAAAAQTLDTGGKTL